MLRYKVERQHREYIDRNLLPLNVAFGTIEKEGMVEYLIAAGSNHQAKLVDAIMENVGAGW